MGIALLFFFSYFFRAFYFDEERKKEIKEMKIHVDSRVT